MPKVINNITCVSYSELVGSGIVSLNVYNNNVRRGKFKRVATGGNGREAQIDYNSLPFEIRKTVDEIHGKINLCKELFRQAVETNYKAREFFAHYVLADGRFLPFDIQEKYSRNAEVLDALIRTTNNSKAFIKALGGNNKNLWSNICSTCSDLTFELGHDLPKNERRLRLKVKEYQDKGFECLISGKFLNKNSAKVVDIEQEATIRELLRKHNNFDNVQIADLYNFFGEKMGWESISPSTVGNYRTKFELDTIAFRKGTSTFDNTKSMMVKRSAPVLPLVYWSADGWDVELLYQKTTTDKNGRTTTTYHNRLTCVFVLDACGKYPVGYAIGEQECGGLIREAFRNAVKHTQELFGVMHKVGQLQTDNYGRGGLTPFYEALSGKFTPAKIGNAKAKTVEPYFKHLNKTYCQLMPNWSGFGVTSRKESQPNAQWINQNRHSIPTREDVIKQIERFIAIERNKKIEAYRAAYQELPQEERLILSEQEYFLNLCETTGRTNRLSHEGLVLQIDNDKRVYDCFEPSFRKNGHVDWKIMFDPADKTKVMAVNPAGTLRFMLEEKHIQPMALRDRSEEDTKQLTATREFNRAIKQNALDVFVEDANVIDEMLERAPELNDTLQKLILTDNHGQHKDNRNAIRLGKSQRLLAKQVEKEEKESMRTQEEEHLEYLKGKVDVNSYLIEE
jgi:ribosomal protein L17